LKKDIRELDLNSLKTFCLQNDMKPYVSKQVYSWLWSNSCSSFDEMSNLSKKNRDIFDEYFCINKITEDFHEISDDGTIKIKFKLHDGNFVEGVLIPQDTRMTACISSQVGCSLSCKFCATGTMARIRNLTAGEIYDQVVAITNKSKEVYNLPLTNIVYMGMGEPLLNYKNVIRSIYFITSDEGLEMSYKRVTLSTSGISKMIRKLADDKVKVNLALSLHAASEEIRNNIMPIGDSNSLNDLRDSLKYYFSKTKRKITYEYVLLKDINDSIKDADDLYKFTKHIPSKVNLIEYNPVEGLGFEKSTEKSTELFMNHLDSRRVNVGLRRSRGKDINAACGQLANKK
jgi:23S rRNA (adenine2503-C2)-methyltransferase